MNRPTCTVITLEKQKTKENINMLRVMQSGTLEESVKLENIPTYRWCV